MASIRTGADFALMRFNDAAASGNVTVTTMDVAVALDTYDSASGVDINVSTASGLATIQRSGTYWVSGYVHGGLAAKACAICVMKNGTEVADSMEKTGAALDHFIEYAVECDADDTLSLGILNGTDSTDLDVFQIEFTVRSFNSLTTSA